jgi:arginine exporter protein ArgO
LGLVYIGAAVLIIIIGMRGLKFIPSTQPSLVFFALGLEFSVLLTYAFSVMYSRSDNETEQDKNKENNHSGNYILSDEFGNSKEIENLLRAYIRSPKPEKISEKRE